MLTMNEFEFVFGNSYVKDHYLYALDGDEFKEQYRDRTWQRVLDLNKESLRYFEVETKIQILLLLRFTKLLLFDDGPYRTITK